MLKKHNRNIPRSHIFATSYFGTNCVDIHSMLPFLPYCLKGGYTVSSSSHILAPRSCQGLCQYDGFRWVAEWVAGLSHPIGSDAIRCDQMRSDAIKCDWMQPDAIRWISCNQMQSDVAKCNQMQANALAHQHHSISIISISGVSLPSFCNNNSRAAEAMSKLAKKNPVLRNRHQGKSTCPDVNKHVKKRAKMQAI